MLDQHANNDAPRETLRERLARGRALRKRVPRSAHAQWQPPANRPDPVALLEATSQGRVPELVPLRYGRMVQSPFAFFRGSAAAMAADLAATPGTGMRVQLCGDCHLLNFGGFGTPERHFIFDVVDFDETLPGPWEWDVKRLAASFVLAGRSRALKTKSCKDAALAAVRSYRQHIREYAPLPVLDVWYARIDGALLAPLARTPESSATSHEHVFLHLSEVIDGRRRIVDRPPLIYHLPADDPVETRIRAFLKHYRATLQEDRRVLLDRYRLEDIAIKVVGVGSVGTRCAVMLLMAGEYDPLVLQFKEAGPSVLEPYAGRSQYASHAQRVVCGQRLLQSASDLFLGWTSDDAGRHYYFRQLRDMKCVVNVDGLSASQLRDYAELCGWALARAHAKAGDPAPIAGYLGKSERFDNAVAAFALAYADQTERDQEAMVTAVRSGRLVVNDQAAMNT
ncbi:MAG TPA: DUF2252 domain-containing protein, partial [Gemmataceae bacterium]|nr:DUF2252 domain-containing protein [Gemmataceae bacterium]